MMFPVVTGCQGCDVQNYSRVTDHGERESKEKELEVWEFRGKDHRQVIQFLCVPLISHKLRDPLCAGQCPGPLEEGQRGCQPNIYFLARVPQLPLGTILLGPGPGSGGGHVVGLPSHSMTLVVPTRGDASSWQIVG